jgi:hypothetical protein
MQKVIWQGIDLVLEWKDFFAADLDDNDFDD